MAVFSGMLGVTLFGIFFTPVFYVVVRWLTARGKQASPPTTRVPVEAAPEAQRDGIIASGH